MPHIASRFAFRSRGIGLCFAAIPRISPTCSHMQPRSFSTKPENTEKDTGRETRIQEERPVQMEEEKLEMTKLGISDKFKVFLKKYGKVGILVYVSVSTSTFITLYSLINMGVDVGAILEWIGLPTPKWSESAGTFLITYTLYKILLPFRLMLTVGLTPSVMNFLKKMRWIN
jgi:hypothetical protein